MKVKDEEQGEAAFFHERNDELLLTLHINFKQVDLGKINTNILLQFFKAFFLWKIFL